MKTPSDEVLYGGSKNRSATIDVMHGQLEKYLETLQRDECYRTDAVLKQSDFERTERIYFAGRNGAEQGPYVRKRFAAESGIGDAYLRIWETQDRGQRFRHLPRIFECYDTESERIVVMEYVKGETLSDMVYRCDPSIDLAIGVFRQLCEAVRELHERFDPPIIHRDLKPSNIMLSSGELTIIDFGIARSFVPGRTEDTCRLGTRNYAPPEQFGFGQTSIRSDIYSMGMVLYYCLTEKNPDASLAETGFASSVVPDAFKPVLARATRLDPQQRYESVAVMREDFERAVDSMRPPTGQPLIWAAIPSPVPAAQAACIGAATKVPRGASPAKRIQNGSAAQPRLSGIPVGVGIAWDAFLVMMWIFLLIADVAVILEPANTLSAYAPWGRWVMGIGAIMVPFSLLAYGLADKRPFARRFSLLMRWRWGLQLVICIAAATTMMFFSAFVAQLAIVS